MDRFDRIYSLHRILSARRTPISLAGLMSELECSRATVQRVIEDARDCLGAPIIYDRESNGYAYKAQAQGQYELPGLWFNASELHALLTLVELLNTAQPGLLTEALAPIRKRIEALLQVRGDSQPDLSRIRILQMASRAVDADVFRAVAGAVVERKKIRIAYHGRERDEPTERWLSPQRLVHYRANWYLDAWCDLRRALRSFSLDRLHVVEVSGKAKDVLDAKLNAHYGSAYGIFAGPAMHTAVLRFSGNAARWVADEQWHPRQICRVLADGRLELRFPYSDPRELLMDIRRHGGEVEVLKPESLRRAVAASLGTAAAQYE